MSKPNGHFHSSFCIPLSLRYNNNNNCYYYFSTSHFDTSPPTFSIMTQVNLCSVVSPVGSPTCPSAIASLWTKDGTYIIEATRKAHACCKSCDATIEAGRLRVGVVYQHRNGFVCINWHHVECYKAVGEIPLQCLEGFTDLDPQQQEMVESYHQLAKCEPHFPLPKTRSCST